MLTQGVGFHWEKDRPGTGCSVGVPFSVMVAIALCSLLVLPQQTSSQLAKGKDRFIGNALSSGIPIWTNFKTYWNQVTPGNAGKWGSVEGSMNSYDWTWLDAIYNYSQINSLGFKDHCFIWGSQQPSWITGLDSAQQRAKVEQWIDTVGSRYAPLVMVDVVNEPFNSPPPYRHALGDSGATGWDWVVTAFAWARQYCFSGTKLLLNEYNVLQDNAITTRYLALIDTLRVRSLIDGIGVQGHYFEFKGAGYTYPINTLKYNLGRLTATGLPVYITEFDINEASDSVQLANYQIYFPLFWENPGVRGITLWGYMQGDMWQQDAYLVRYNGTERPALQWLRRYIASPLPPTLVSPLGTSGELRNPLLVWRSSETASSYRMQVSTSFTFSSFAVDTTVTDTLCRLAPLSAFATYYWRVSASNDSGPSSYSSVTFFRTGDQIEAVEGWKEFPAEFTLQQNYPNPFNPSTTIEYTVGGTRGHPPASQAGGSGSGNVRLAVYDLLGREVAVLVDERQPAGTYRVRFDGTGRSSGVYVCRLFEGQQTQSIKMILTK